MTPAWIVCAWPPVLWQADSAARLHLVHLGTRVLHYGGDAAPCSGQTLWGEATHDRSAGVAWDWVQITGDIVAMADPMSVVTNLRLVGNEGEVLTALESARYLNEIVHALPWQNEVQRAIHAVAA